MPVSKGKLKPDDEKRLRTNYTALIDEIDGKFFVDKLFMKYVFTEDDKQEILNQPSRSKRARMLLDILFQSGPGDAYNEFFAVLKSDYEHMAKMLTETKVDETEQIRPDYSWFDSIPDSVKNRVITDADASIISFCFDKNWQHALVHLGLSSIMIDRERQNSPWDGITTIITNLLIKWRHRLSKQATLKALVDVLIEVDRDEVCIINWECVEKALNKYVP